MKTASDKPFSGQNSLQPISSIRENTNGLNQAKFPLCKIKKITEEVRVYLPTPDEDCELRMLLDSNGYRWGSGANLRYLSFRNAGSVLMIQPDQRVIRSACQEYAISFREFCHDYLIPNK
ncbi:MAG: hypothetical protein HDS62_09475 [Bacteroidales bacterium]|nr:hypothetical protein [Bacteroidales bacterium]